jgi:hypothetical protein
VVAESESEATGGEADRRCSARLCELPGGEEGNQDDNGRRRAKLPKYQFSVFTDMEPSALL